MTSHVRAIEDRAHAEVDRARQESRELKSLLSALQKEHATAEKSYLKAVEQGNSKAADAHRQAEVQRARADALEDQLARLRSEERSVGKECGSTGRSRWSTYH